MKPIYLFNVASKHNEWLTARQSVVADNIANSSTPGFKARDLKPFVEVINETHMEIARTNRAHLTVAGAEAYAPEINEEAGRYASHSGNTVALEREFAKIGGVNRAYSLNTAVIKAFNRMLLLSVKG